MPIPLDEWNQGSDMDSIQSRIKRFLASSKDKAFSIDEITNDLFPTSDDLAGTFDHKFYSGVIRTILDNLVENGIVKFKIITSSEGDNAYFRMN